MEKFDFQNVKFEQNTLKSAKYYDFFAKGYMYLVFFKDLYVASDMAHTIRHCCQLAGKPTVQKVHELEYRQTGNSMKK